jgi:tetratricopeptide (TPR) repeat protein
VLVIIGVLIILLLSPEAIASLVEGYSHRYFTHSERLLTQFRILVYYLFQIVYPNPAHLSIAHDIIISKSLFDPWTTLPAIMLIMGGLWCSLFFLPSLPLLCFGGLFFLSQHAVESSFLPLELIFEHRNYIPTMFLFVGIAGGFHRLIHHYRSRNIFMYRFLALSSVIALFFIAMGTYSRNDDWRSEKTLWENALIKAPNNSRALHNLAFGYYDRIGETAKALELYQQSLDAHVHRKDSTSTTFHNIGYIHYKEKEYSKALGFLNQAIEKNPRNIKTHMLRVQAYMALSDWEKASSAIDEIIHEGPRVPQLFRLKGKVLLNKNEAKAAIEWFIRTGQYQWEDLAAIGRCLHILGEHVRSDFFFRCAQAITPNKPFILLSRLGLYLDSDEIEKADNMADLFIKSVPMGGIEDYIEALINEKTFYPLEYQRLMLVLNSAMHRKLAKLEQDEKLIFPKATRLLGAPLDGVDGK